MRLLAVIHCYVCFFINKILFQRQTQVSLRCNNGSGQNILVNQAWIDYMHFGVLGFWGFGVLGYMRYMRVYVGI